MAKNKVDISKIDFQYVVEYDYKDNKRKITVVRPVK